MNSQQKRIHSESMERRRKQRSIQNKAQELIARNQIKCVDDRVRICFRLLDGTTITPVVFNSIHHTVNDLYAFVNSARPHCPLWGNFMLTMENSDKELADKTISLQDAELSAPGKITLVQKGNGKSHRKRQPTPAELDYETNARANVKNVEYMELVIDFELLDGTTITQVKFNGNHTVQDLFDFVDTARPTSSSNYYLLKPSTNQELTDGSMTLREAKLKWITLLVQKCYLNYDSMEVSRKKKETD